jgi:F-box domain
MVKCMPNELLHLVMLFCDFHARWALSLTCRRLHEISRDPAFAPPFRLGQLMFCESSCHPQWGTLLNYKWNGVRMLTTRGNLLLVIYTGEDSVHQLDDDTQTWRAWDKSEEARFFASELTPLRRHTRLLEKLKARGGKGLF